MVVILGCVQTNNRQGQNNTSHLLSVSKVMQMWWCDVVHTSRASQSQWMLPSGEYLHRIATTAVMVIHVSETQKKGKKK